MEISDYEMHGTVHVENLTELDDFLYGVTKRRGGRSLALFLNTEDWVSFVKLLRILCEGGLSSRISNNMKGTGGEIECRTVHYRGFEILLCRDHDIPNEEPEFFINEGYFRTSKRPLVGGSAKNFYEKIIGDTAYDVLVENGKVSIFGERNATKDASEKPLDRFEIINPINHQPYADFSELKSILDQHIK